MNRGPVKDSRPAGRSFAEKAADAWGANVPDWVAELVRIADAEGLGGAEKRVNYSRSAISTIISGKYNGDLGRVEQMVRGALMAETVDCPVLGEIGRDRCLIEQKEPFRATSRHRAQLFHACKTCPQRR
ncbi:transcriptional regulator [Mesorhizobium tamadayense]|uniref:Transcriptional regulator n=1 Tax=Mesorhizobium tamadayense TaxID=425306 RepID=A0A3P3FH90_9HYPH|nr:transcriptional regulator [Mesorhizobium tamadayense]RRH98050.1 transcriptional regulator [Mesorhizobium tamadayense]